MLMVRVGAAWLLGDLFQPLVLLHRGALAHLVLAYPRAFGPSRSLAGTGRLPVEVDL
jgi:hypothetical protein